MIARLGLMLLFVAGTGVGAAENAPNCTAAVAGQLSLQAGVRCQCRFFPESHVTGTAAGHRWDCGILRGRMNDEIPATANPYPYPLPDALALDRTIILKR